MNIKMRGFHECACLLWAQSQGMRAHLNSRLDAREF